MDNLIYLTEQDYKRLVDLVQQQRQGAGMQPNIAKLGEELKRARRVASEEIPAEVVTMNSSVLLKDLKSGKEMEITLVYPKDADVNTRKISILAPVGTAIIGCKEGDEVEWPVPSGTINYKIEKVTFQPEASGNFSL
ncbi:nucleoside diphosphate kinase regulator [Pontibacter sp. FD36]|uniref:GreA/GreB family elongation factor n=1 Tax=Pontibacter lucknowensis TaxID=1077936 RepID=A0A1N6WHN2_9BACT|nr:MULTISPECIES: nucleoside diphosphate kinase regulator [Pontibacter]EJF08151.1 GreA/GreB family elongation factor [Pontibacter sp. BAB1700]MBF8965104.1 nucleoside diphosphate kinase regulator [Pontibacter sp. FD36]SIQ89571.1 GreA/GreB family elongation factor [Pontibacter lucknowensis]